MDNYCLFYIPKSSLDPVNDILTIFFGGSVPVTNRLDKDNVSVLFNKEIPVGYLIKNFSKLCKIKINGMIYLPNDFLIDVINGELAKANLSLLPYKESSGFVIGKILSKEPLRKSFIYEVDLGDKKINAESTYGIKENSFVVIATVGTYLLPGRMIDSYKVMQKYICEGRICSFDDLQIPSEDIYSPLVIDEESEVGKDFFSMEEKVNAWSWT